MLKAEKRLQIEFDYWVKHFNRRLNNALDLLQSQQEAIERLDEHIESLVKYNQKTVHPNLVRLRQSVASHKDL